MIGKNILPSIFILCIVTYIIVLIIDTLNSLKWKKRDLILCTDYSPKTGDIVLFNGPSFTPKPTLSFFIKLFTNSDISHVGMIWVNPTTNVPWVWHSGPAKGEYIVPYIEGRSHYAHLVPFEEVLEKEKGKIIIREISEELDANKMKSFIEENIGSHYAFDLALSWYHTNFGYLPLGFLPKREEKYWSCGELVYHTLVHMNVLDSAIESNRFFPGDFSKEARNQLWTINGYSFGKDTFIMKE